MANRTDSASFWLTVSVANGDIDGKIIIDGTEATTGMYSAIPTDELVAHTPVLMATHLPLLPVLCLVEPRVYAVR